MTDAPAGNIATATSSAGDIVGTRNRWYFGLLLVAAPVLLVCWLIIYPIIAAVVQTVWVPSADGTNQFSIESNRYFFSES